MIKEQYEHEEVIYIPEIKAFIAIHNTNLGPAIGGTRMYPFLSKEEALNDVLLLSKAMTYKSALAKLPFGGGKGLIIGDPKKDKVEALLIEYAEVINSLKGKFYTGCDMGFEEADITTMSKQTKYVAGLPIGMGGRGQSAIPTAQGIVTGMRACCEVKFGDSSLKDRTIAIQGLGAVGSRVVDLLWKEGARLFVSDIDMEKARTISLGYSGIKACFPKDIYEVDVDIFSPCAMGGIINEETIPKLRCKIIAGCANNQLKDEALGKELLEQNILYAPDYAINAGGLIGIAGEILKHSEEETASRINNIYSTVEKILKLSLKEHEPANLIANREAEKIFMESRSE